MQMNDDIQVDWLQIQQLPPIVKYGLMMIDKNKKQDPD
jgi:hypothetical protein